MKKYKVKIWKNDPFRGLVAEEKMMTREQKNDATKFAEERIHKFFRWEQQDERFKHLLVWCEFEGESFCIYNDGYLFTEQDFDVCVASRGDIKFVRAYHRR